MGQGHLLRQISQNWILLTGKNLVDFYCRSGLQPQNKDSGMQYLVLVSSLVLGQITKINAVKGRLV